MALRLVIAEDHFLVREGLAALMGESDELDLLATADDADSLLAAVRVHRPDVVLTDIRMPPTHTMEGIAAARQIRAEHPEIGVLVLSQYVEESYAHELLKDGASGLGYLLKERVADLDELVRSLKEVARGGSVLDPKVVEAVIRRRDRERRSPLSRLTPRERDVLEQMAQGRNNAAIAAALVLTERAVEKHINSLFQKLSLSEEPLVHRRVMAVLTLLREDEPSA